MGEEGGLLFWGVLLVAMVVFMFLPQWNARRRQKRREEELAVGQRVVTIGGLIGDLTYLDFDANIARVMLGQDLEISILPGAIRGQYEAAAGADEGDGEDGTASDPGAGVSS